TDARMTETVARIESTLANVGGVRRYLTDTYYGGGEWVLLACWLAWYHLSAGNEERASRVIEWVESKADDSGALPEQVSDNLNDSSFYQRWREQWGEIASPLLWSHAMYLIALEAAAD
ncbi:MAG: glycoside hydrolase, partial [Actinobacteria bacterium]|nr:glycoside hydrolase [Actinomycetota bacterium]